MRPLALKKARALLVLVLALAGTGLVSSSAVAATVTIDLCAVTGTATLTGAVSVPIWGFGVPSTPGDCTSATAGLPGPVLSVNENDAVTINVTNALPSGHSLTFEIPGITFAPGPAEAAAGATVSRSFIATDPGTYLYESSGDAGRQVALGLAGALLVRSNTTAQAYDVAASSYDAEAVLVLSAVDPNLNAAPETFTMLSYRATYWLINGKAYPDTTAIPATSGAHRLLLRYLNAGYDNTSISLLGLHQRVIARDARLLHSPFDAVAETIPAGATEDSIAVVPTGGAPSSHGFPLYNRQLHLTSGTLTTPTPAAGGMLTFITP